MCWATTYKPMKQQSDIDIVVYKILCSCMISPFCGYRYKYDQIQPLVNLEIDYAKFCDIWEINEGYHSYETIDAVRNAKWNLDSSYIYERIIPAYTDFYVNENGEIVSSTLIVKRKITKLNSFRYNVCILWNKIKERIRDI